jgi:DNA segregation ATPase FtsK/SpoIIIE, S-DNA-T family
MANKLKKPSAPKAENKKEPLPAKGTLKPEKEEKVDLKKLAKDERTRKIIGAVSVFISILLFLAFVSYFFTWKEDQDKVFRGSAVLFDNELKVSNLLGRLGAYLSHFFIYKGFGVASMLFCSFFFINGINLLTGRKVYSFWKNLRYVIVGLLVVSVCMSFLFPNNDLPLGGGVGKMINNWLTGILGYIGAGALLFVSALGWFIWQFNPAFKIPSKTKKQIYEPGAEYLFDEHTSPVADAKKTYMQEELEALSTDSKANSLKDGNGVVVIQPKKKNESEIEFKIITKEEPVFENPVVEKSIVEELTHKDDLTADIPFEIKIEDHEE